MISDYYKTNFKVLRTIKTVDSNNFEIESDALILSGLGYFEQLKSEERYVNYKKQIEVGYRLFTDIIDVKESDKVEINSVMYEIDSLIIYNSHHLEIYLSRIN